MNEPSIGSRYLGAKDRMRREIQSLDASQLSGTTVEEWTEYFVNQSRVHPIQCDLGPPSRRVMPKK